MKSVTIPNYYEEGTPDLEVQLDEKLSPGQNAQRYFKLYQKARSAQRLAAEQVGKDHGGAGLPRRADAQPSRLRGGEPSCNELREELEKQGYVRSQPQPAADEEAGTLQADAL